MDPQTYVVTGASKGLGRALALALAGHGYPVLALARPSTELDEIGGLLSSVAPGSRSIECDLSNPTSIANAASLISQQTTFLPVWSTMQERSHRSNHLTKWTLQTGRIAFRSTLSVFRI
jgi:NAD(P)-dependent dehydrogenase (short-subunit alcohol dehydrogenase family)